MKNHVIVPGHTTLKSHSHFHQQHLDIRSITTSPELRVPFFIREEILMASVSIDVLAEMTRERRK